MGRLIAGFLLGVMVGAKHKDMVLHYVNMVFDWVIQYMQNTTIPPLAG